MFIGLKETVPVQKYGLLMYCWFPSAMLGFKDITREEKLSFIVFKATLICLQKGKRLKISKCMIVFPSKNVIMIVISTPTENPTPNDITKVDI